MTTTWHNASLCILERDGIASDEETSLSRITEALAAVVVSATQDATNPHCIHELSRLVSTHSKMKYELPISVRVDVLRIVTELYHTSIDTLSMPVRGKLLSTARNQIRKKTLNFAGQWEFVHWRELWQEAFGIVTRARKHQVIASEGVLSGHVTTIIDLLHSARRFITSQAVMDDMVAMAMALLQDTRTPACLQGLVLLVTCLPTHFARYDEMLPQWVAIWNSIEHNAAWDASWLTLFARARKHTSTFDWRLLTSKFVLKSRQLLKLPVVRGRSPLGHDFPNTFPGYYTKMMTNAGDASQVALKKLAKILYSLTLSGGEDALLVLTNPITLTPANIAASSGSAEFPAMQTELSFPGHNAPAEIRAGAVEIVLFLQSLRTYLYPSNAGGWTGQLALFLTCLVNEISRHVGRSIAFSLYGNTREAALSGLTVFEAPMHNTTVRFLAGTLTSIMMEGLYGRNPTMMNACCYGLKNLVGIDPSLGEIIIPFLLTALDPAAVNQSHQAPAALAALSVIVKPLLFPCPVMLRHLPDLLRLALPGVDPNDATKTHATLQMHSAFLAWLPLQGSYTAPPVDSYPPDYLALTHSTEAPARGFILSQQELQAQLDALGAAVQEWVPAFLDKIFALLESLEEHKKGQRANTVVSVISETMGYFFQALMDPALRALAEERVLDFLRQNTLVNAGKAAGKILVSMVETHKDILPRVLATLVDADVAAVSCSPDKLAFRLRLVCGAVRCAGAEAMLASLPTLRALLTPALFFHAEKKVRKAAVKLLKDVLRGATAIFPTNTCPVTESAYVIGAPNSTSVELTWNTPSPAVLAAMTQLLRDTFVKAMTELGGMVADMQAAGAGGGGSGIGNGGTKEGGEPVLGAKKLEEAVVQRMHIMCKGLRGAAEVLGDGWCEVDIPASGDGSQETDMEVDASAASAVTTTPPVLLRTCAAALVASLPPADQELLGTLRAQTVRLLIQLGSCLAGMSDGHAMVSLRNSASIQASWVKLLRVVVCQRTAFIKNSDNVRKWFNMSKRVCRTIVVREVQRGLKRRLTHSPAFDSAAAFARSQRPGAAPAMRSVEYWKCHDLSTNFVCQRAWLQHAQRLHELGLSSMSAVAKTPMGPAYRECLRQLALLCGHEYDTIRKKAQNVFSHVSNAYGTRRIVAVVRQVLLPSVTSVGARYFQANGAMVILQMTYVMRRVARDWVLTQDFLRAVSTCPAMIAAVPEQDKREILMNRVSDTFVKYTGMWSHLPLPPGAGREAADGLVSTILATLGYDPLGSPVGDTSATGLRYDAFAAYSILHLIGHADVTIPCGVWVWALRTLSSAHGEPSQLIALAALSRLLMGAVKGSIVIAPETAAAVRAIFADKAFFPALLAGLSHARPKASEDGMSAQWSRGVAHILHSAEYLKQILPRSLTSIRYETNAFSRMVHLENAGLVMNLVASGLLAEPGGKLTLATVTELLAASKDLPKASEGELKASNATRAELFAGLLHAITTHRTAADAAEYPLITQALVTYLREAADKVSMDYCRDWAEAVHFCATAAGVAAQEGDDVLDSPLARAIILDDFAQLVRTELSGEGDDGFAKQGKRLLLCKAVVLGDISASCARGLPSSPVAAAVISTMQGATAGNLVSSYRSSRSEISSILCILADSTHAVADLGFFARQMVELSAGVGEEKEDATIDAARSAMLKCASETACGWLQGLSQFVPMVRGQAVVPDLLAVALRGSGHGEIEVAKSCHDTVLLLVNSVQVGIRHASGGDILGSVVRVLLEHQKHPSWHVRETVQLSLGALLVSNWVSLSATEKGDIKTSFVESFQDVKPEVAQLGRAGLSAYLGFKTGPELRSLADSYVRNSQALVLRDKQRRKAAQAAGGVANLDKPDAKHVLTINMIACLILCRPYDIDPASTPALIAAIVAHQRLPLVGDIVTRTVLDFTRTHQDRLGEFKAFFNVEELAALQGAAGASYLT